MSRTVSRGFRSPSREAAAWSLFVVVSLVALAAPLGLPLTTISSLGLIAIFCLIVLGLNFMIETTGLVSLGQAGIVAAGAYGTIALIVHANVTPALALVGGTLIAGVIGLILAIPSLRVKSVYFAIVTIIFGSTVQSITNLFSGVTGGQNGLYATQSGLVGYGGTVPIYWIAVAVLIVALVLCGNIERSQVGHALRAAKFHAPAAASLGIDVRMHQILAVTIGNLLTGLGGGLLALQTGGVSPDSFGIDQSTLYLVGAVVGGTGSVFGAVLGGVFVQGLTEGLASASVFLDLIFGGLLLISLVVLPDGLSGIAARASRPLTDLLPLRPGPQSPGPLPPNSDASPGRAREEGHPVTQNLREVDS